KQVTVQAISQRAGVSESTVYRHFPTKEQLVLWDEADRAIEQHLIKNLGKGSPFEVLQRAFVQAYANLAPEGLRQLARRSRFIDAVPEVFAAMALSLEEDRMELQEALTGAYGRDPLEMELTVRFALSALITGVDAWVAAGAQGDLPGSIDRAFQAAHKTLD
ncbi:MAG: helix-turn-helix domain containing protein, partial [Sulfitobacter sp.]|nr:helix-turn-helix domain containing protein [Sulfitobacter sp.]